MPGENVSRGACPIASSRETEDEVSYTGPAFRVPFPQSMVASCRPWVEVCLARWWRRAQRRGCLPAEVTSGSVSPTARVVGLRRLTGGSPQASVHRVSVMNAQDHRHLVLRRWMPGGPEWNAWTRSAVLAEGSVLDARSGTKLMGRLARS